MKTRLVGALTPEEAARLHAAFVEDLLARLENGDFELRVAWAVSAGEELPATPIASLRQEGAGLGERLYRGLTTAAREHRRVAAVGSDHPELTRERIEEAFTRLEESDVVLGPAADGGYDLIAVRSQALTPRLFAEIPWSTDRVLRATRDRCSELGLRVEELAESYDVDRPEDLERLAAALSEEPDRAPRTAAVLAELSMLDLDADSAASTR